MDLHYFRDFLPTAHSDLLQRKTSNLQTNLGPNAQSDVRNMNGFSLLSSLGSHDLSAMRDVLGMPEECLCATRSDEGEHSWWWTALFKYKGFKAYYEVSDEFAVRKTLFDLL